MRVTVQQKNKKEVVTVGIQGPAGATGTVAIQSATDVDLSDTTDGSVLVYSTANGKWTATRRLEKQELEGGQF
jgi:hypothetical protein